jgi:hypothetical protein
VLLTLQQVGNVKYTGWTLRVPCSTDREVITELQKQAKQMEEELSEWKEIVRIRREKYYELNYFNTMQLLALRRELGKLKADCHHVISFDVLALLQSISSQVSPVIVSDAVCQVTTKPAYTTDEVEVAICEDAEMKDSVEFSHPDEQKSSDSLLSSRAPNESLQADINKNLPTLTEDDLNEAQKEMAANISSRLYCTKQLVLLAFEECPGDDNDRYDYENWCSNNLNRDILDEGSEDEGIESDSDGEASSDSDDSEADSQQFKYSSGKHGWSFC